MSFTGLLFDAQARQANQAPQPSPIPPGLPWTADLDFDLGSITYVQEFLDQAIYASPTAAVQAAHDSLPLNGGVLQMPPGNFVLDNLQFSRSMVFQGVAGGTFLTPGPSGRIFTSSYAVSGGSRNGTFVLRDIAIGDPSWPPVSPNRSYAVPLVEFDAWSGLVVLDNVYGRISGSGTFFYFNSSGNLVVRNTHIYAGAFGIPFEFAATYAPYQADTISFENVVVEGLYFAIFRPESGTSTVLFKQAKLVNAVNAGLLDHSLSQDIVAGSQTAVLQAGQGASWNIGDSLYVEGDYPTDSAQRSGKTVEVNPVTNVVGDTLTVANPWRYNHGTNGNTFTVQALRSGVGLSLASNLQVVQGYSCHFEDVGFCIIDYGVDGSLWEGCLWSANRFIRLAGNAQDLTIGLNINNPRSGANFVLDLPTWLAPGNSNLNRFHLNGPWIGPVPSYLDDGATRQITADPPGTIMLQKMYVQDDPASSLFRRSFHAPAGDGAFVAMRFGFGTFTDQLDIYYSGRIVMNDNLDIAQAGKGLQVKEGANAKQGVSTLVAGTVVVANTSVTANSRIILSPQETGALTGILRVSARVAGTSFTISSSVNTDTVQVAWEIFEPG